MTDWFVITPMAECHLETLAALERLCFSAPWSAAALREELENPLAAFYVAEAGGCAAGYAGMNYVLDEGFIDNVAVHPDYRRRGVAAALLDRLLAAAREKRLTTLSLEVRRSNEAAIRLYEKYGFTRQGERRGFYDSPKEDALIMTKFLTCPEKTPAADR